MSSFLSLLRTQRWDDHRYYHHSLVNRSLHLLSASTFVAAYAVMFKDPWLSSLMGWLVSMTSRQAGHFFFEPRDYDHINQATDEYKEEIKVGYNIKRKIVLMAVWASSPVLLLLNPTLFGLVEAPAGWLVFAQHLGYLWLAVGIGGLLFRVGQLCVTQDAMTGLVWATKIVTDPFHDIKLYWKAPYQLLRGLEHTLAGEAEEEVAESY